MLTTGRRALVRAAVALALLAPLAPLAPVAATAASPAPSTTRVIVVLDGRPVVASGAQPALSADKAALRRQIASSGIPAKITAEFSQALNAVAVTTDAAGAAALRAMPGVAGVYPDTTMHASVDPDVSLIGAPQVWATRDPLGKNVEGGGETVAVIDTGIDYTHPDLGGCLGRGCQVVDGYDFVNGDADPKDDNGHGTHVAGTIAGAQTGVAPKASLAAYKVLDSSGYGSESTVLQGFEAAVTAGADVINLSLTGPPTPDDPLEQASENAIHAGVVVVAAAGNDGPGESTVGSPAEAPDVLAVGASISGVQLPTVTVTTPTHRPISVTRLGLSANPPPGGADLDLVDVGAGNESGYDGKDVTGKAVYVEIGRASCRERVYHPV